MDKNGHVCLNSQERRQGPLVTSALDISVQLILKLRTQNLFLWCGAQGTDFFDSFYIMNLTVFVQIVFLFIQGTR